MGSGVDPTPIPYPVAHRGGFVVAWGATASSLRPRCTRGRWWLRMAAVRPRRLRSPYASPWLALAAVFVGSARGRDVHHDRSARAAVLGRGDHDLRGRNAAASSPRHRTRIPRGSFFIAVWRSSWACARLASVPSSDSGPPTSSHARSRAGWSRNASLESLRTVGGVAGVIVLLVSALSVKERCSAAIRATVAAAQSARRGPTAAIRPRTYGAARPGKEKTLRAPGRAWLPLLRFRPGGVGLGTATRRAVYSYPTAERSHPRPSHRAPPPHDEAAGCDAPRPLSIGRQRDRRSVTSWNGRSSRSTTPPCTAVTAAASTSRSSRSVSLTRATSKPASSRACVRSPSAS